MTAKTFTASLLSALLIIAWPWAASAHTHMEKSAPADKAVLTSAPKTVELWFSGDVQAEWCKIEVTDAGGKRVDMEKVSGDSADPKHIQTELNPLASGSYQVKWNVISGDGHRVKGSFSFSVQQ